MLKKTIKILTALSLIIIYCYMCCACEPTYNEEDNDGYYKHPDFKTEYSKEEHVDRIWDLTVERFKEDFDNGKIKSLYVDIVYAFYDEDPEYFLVEIEYFEEFTAKHYFKDFEITTNFIHTIGYINQDKYYSTQSYRYFCYGKSAYSTYGARDCKKYYGNSVQAVLIDGKLIQVSGKSLYYSYPEIDNSREIGKEVDYSKLKDYMSYNIQISWVVYPFKYVR